jgi:hypothetical protein
MGTSIRGEASSCFPVQKITARLQNMDVQFFDQKNRHWFFSW